MATTKVSPQPHLAQRGREVQRCESVRLVPIALSAQGRIASRMIDEWNELRDPSEEAWWIRKSGGDQFSEHLGRLREWVTGRASNGARAMILCG